MSVDMKKRDAIKNTAMVGAALAASSAVSAQADGSRTIPESSGYSKRSDDLKSCAICSAYRKEFCHLHDASVLKNGLCDDFNATNPTGLARREADYKDVSTDNNACSGCTYFKASSKRDTGRCSKIVRSAKSFGSSSSILIVSARGYCSHFKQN